jgi:GMP synthase-like glutamine amidotransferase
MYHNDMGITYPRAKGNRSMKQVLALQFCWDDPPGYLGAIMQEHDIFYEVVEVETAPVPDPTEFHAVIAMGGPQHVGDNEKYPYLVGVESAIRKTVAENIPYLGLCLGGQLLAHALGAPVKRHSMTPIGFFEVQITEEGKADPLFRGLPGFQQVFHWHEDTFDIPMEAVQLATNAQTENQVFRYGLHAYGTQYHIEVTSDLLDIWLDIPESRQDIAKTLGEGAVDTFISNSARHFPLYLQHSRIMFENFLRIGGLIV